MMIERTGKYIGTGVASVINLLNIERIVLGGGVMQAGELILNPIIQEAKRRAFQPCFEATQIVLPRWAKMLRLLARPCWRVMRRSRRNFEFRVSGFRVSSFASRLQILTQR